METAKIFKNGRSQAVRLPVSCRVQGKEVFVKSYGGMVLLIPKKNPWGPLVESLGEFSEDFMLEGRQQLPVQKRRGRI